MKIMLINPFSGADASAGRFKRLLYPMPPIPIAYLAAVLEKAGIETCIYDDYIYGGDKTGLREAIEKEKPRVVGISAVTPTAPGAYACSRYVRENHPEIKIVMGNVHSDVYYEHILNDNLADIVCFGEGEITVVDLMRTLESNGDLGAVPGIAFRRDGEVKVTAPRPYIEDLDSIPFPAWHMFPIEKYKLFSFAVVKTPGTLVLGSRGCPYSCNFCSLKVMGQRRRRRSIENIVDEIEWLYDKFGYVQPSFIDPIFPINKTEGLKFANEVIKRGLHKKIVWITETRVDLVDKELMEALYESGLRRVMYGVESGTQDGVDSIEKEFSIETARYAVRTAKKAGVQVIGFFIIGVPGDTPKSIDETVNFAIDTGVDFAKFNVFVPYPGTKIYNELLAAGKLPDHMNFERYTSYPSEGNPPIWLPENISHKEMLKLQRRAFFKFYFHPRVAFKQLFQIRTLGISDLVEGMFALAG